MTGKGILDSIGRWLVNLASATETDIQLPALTAQLAASRKSLAQVVSETQSIATRRQEMGQSQELQRLTSEVSETSTVIDAAITLISGLSQQIRDAANSGDTQALTDLADSLDQQQNRLAAAITANTSAPQGGSTGNTGTGTAPTGGFGETGGSTSGGTSSGSTGSTGEGSGTPAGETDVPIP